MKLYLALLAFGLLVIGLAVGHGQENADSPLTGVLLLVGLLLLLASIPVGLVKLWRSGRQRTEED